MLSAIRRAALVAALAFIPAIAATVSAFADGSGPTPVPVGGGGTGVTCPPGGGACRITVSAPGSSGGGGSPGHGGGGSGSAGGSGAASNPAPVCTYAPDPTYEPLPGEGDIIVKGERGSWYLKTCSDGANPPTSTTTVVWLPTPPPAAATLPTPAELAAQARKNLLLPKPVIASNPGIGRPQMVGIPMWAWLQSSVWSPVSASASVPGESVTATATPVSVAWDFGDGTSATCLGPGTPFEPGDNPSAPSPDCGHTYRTASGDAPGAALQLSATVTWRVSWAGAGQAGVLNGLATTSSVAVTVQQSQAIVTGTG